MTGSWVRLNRFTRSRFSGVQNDRYEPGNRKVTYHTIRIPNMKRFAPPTAAYDCSNLYHLSVHNSQRLVSIKKNHRYIAIIFYYGTKTCTKSVPTGGGHLHQSNQCESLLDSIRKQCIVLRRPAKHFQQPEYIQTLHDRR